MAITEKQKAVIRFAQENGGEITKKQAMTIINDHYCNGEKHVGEVLSRMVKRGMLTRIKPGLFRVGGLRPSEALDPNQSKLF